MVTQTCVALTASAKSVLGTSITQVPFPPPPLCPPSLLNGVTFLWTQQKTRLTYFPWENLWNYSGDHLRTFPRENLSDYTVWDTSGEIFPGKKRDYTVWDTTGEILPGITWGTSRATTWEISQRKLEGIPEGPFRALPRENLRNLPERRPERKPEKNYERPE